MAFTYPTKPWTDGQEIKMMVGGREVVVAKYDASKNLWQHLHMNDEGILFYATACQVLLDPSKCPCPDIENVDWDDLKNVSHALEWLHYWVSNLLDRMSKLEDRVTHNETNIQQIIDLISAINDLNDLTGLIEKLDEILDRLDNINAADVKQAPLPGQAGFEVPDGVKSGTQQETNYYLADLINTNINELEHLIWFGTQPPDEDEEYQFWWDTLRLELLISFNGQWWPVSNQEAINALNEALIEETQARIAGDEALAEAARTYTLETEPLAVRPQIQLVDQDQNFSNVHFDSSGGLDVYSTVDGIRYDGTQLVDANELQDQRLDRIESELDAFIRQKESGTWGYRADQTASSTLEAEYHLVTNLTQAEYDAAIDSCTNSYQQCLVDSAGDPTAASECNRIQVECRAAVPDVGTNSPVNGNFMIAKTLYINEKDVAGFTHSFGDTSVGDYIELIDEPGGNEYHLALISSKTYNSGTYTFEIVPVVSKGDLTFANGTEFHFFSLTQDADIETLDNRYLKLTGGDLTGNLHIRDGKKLYLHGTASRIYLEDDEKKINTTLYASGLIDSKGTIRSDKSSGVCLEARQDGTTTFKVYADGSSQTTKAITESTNNQAHVTKGWTDGRFAKGGGIKFSISGNTLYVEY